MTEPEIQQTILSHTQLQEVLGEILLSDPRAQMRTRNDPKDRPLADRIACTTDGPVQIRYTHDNAQWIDTLVPLDASSVRLIRTRLSQSPQVEPLPEL